MPDPTEPAARAATVQLPGAKPIPNCSAHPFDWVLFLLTLFLLCLSWWLAELPTLFTPPEARTPAQARRPWRTRLSRFVDAVAWNCARLLQPSYVAIVALARTRARPGNWPRLYYFGYEQRGDDDEAPPAGGERFGLTRTQWAKVAVMDGGNVLVACLLIARGAVLSWDQENPIPLWLGGYLLATLPPSLLGAHLFTMAALRRPPRRFLVGLYAFLGLTVLGAAFVVAAVFAAAPGSYGAPLAGALAVAWATVMVPLPTMYCCYGRLHVLFYLFAVDARVVPLLVDLLRDRATFPFCSINFPGVVAAYGVVAGMGVLWFGIVGGGMCEKYRGHLEKMVELEGDNREEQVALQGVETGGDEGRQELRAADGEEARTGEGTRTAECPRSPV